MKHYSVYVELEQRNPVPELITTVRDYLDRFGHSPAVGTSPRGWLDVQASAPGDSAVQAAAAVVAHAESASGVSAIAVTALTEDEFDARQGFAPVVIPDLVSVSQAADILQVSRQRVQQMIDAGQFVTARKVGNATVLATSEVTGRVHSTALPHSAQ